METNDNLLMICECGSLDHTIFLWYDKTGGWPELYGEIHLRTHWNIFKRIWYSLKYILGYKSRYGCWDEFIFSKENEEKLRSFLNERNDYGRTKED